MTKHFKLAVAIAALIALLASLFSGCCIPSSDNNASNNNTPGSNQSTNQNQQNGDTHTSSDSNKLAGVDIFDGQRFNEMIWGYYEADCYEYNGSHDDANEFLTDMEYVTIDTQNGEYEFAGLPLAMHAGKYSHFMNSFSYEGEYYEPYTEIGKTMFRKAYIAEVGDMTEAQFQKIEKLMELDVVSLTLAFRTGATYLATLIYEVENNNISLYDFTVDEDYNLSIANEPFVTLQFLHSGNKLSLAYKGVQRDYLASGLKESDPSFSCSGFALNAENKYKDLEGFSFYSYGEDDGFTAYIDLSNGNSPIDPVMEYNKDTGEFSLSWQQCWTYTARGLDKVDDPRVISGFMVPCTNYGFNNYCGFFLMIDGTCYRYLMSQEEYDERMYSSILGGNSYKDLNESDLEDLAAAKKNILEELKKALDAAGIKAEIDTVSGKVSLDATFLFATNSSEVSAEGKDYLNRFIDAYTSVVLGADYAEYISNIIIEGHTDTSGSYMLNQTLSEDRANAVASHCIARSSALADIIKTKGCSYDYPVYNIDGSVNMDKSRRVTFSFVFGNI